VTDTLAALLHEGCVEDWQRRFANGAQAITMHDVSAHDETATRLTARGVHVGCDMDLAYEAGRQDGAHEATGLDVERLAAALRSVEDQTGYALHVTPTFAAAIARAYATTPQPAEMSDNQAALESLPYAVQAAEFNLPHRVVVDQHGHYWRDYGDFLSMCPVSDENVGTEVVAAFILTPQPAEEEGR